MFEAKQYVTALKSEFESSSNIVLAVQQRKYLKDQFEFLGISAPLRRDIQRPFLQSVYLPGKEEAKQVIKQLWGMGKREYQYFAQELFYQYRKQFKEEDLDLIEWMIRNDSWWDTVDYIAANLVGHYLLTFPELRHEVTQRWIDSEHLWLRRSAILFQLKYKSKLDEHLLSSIIHRLIPTKEFFINKAIGWILRSHARTNPSWVLKFVNHTALSALSKREALKHLGS